MRVVALVTLTLLCTAGVPAQERGRPQIPSAIGPYINLKHDDFKQSRRFRSDGKIVLTHDFYWYDVRTGAHIKNGDGTDALTTHPATLDDFSYKSVAWHKKQLLDMIDAGIDVVLPVYWGAPSEHRAGASMHWSFAGLPPLARAAEELIRQGKTPPAIGLFYDTSTLAHNSWNVHVDLTTDYGKRWFYATIRDFFSLIPPRLWALIDGRPIVVLYSAAFAQAHDQGCIDYLRTEFPRQFGGLAPYIIREASWRVKADNIYAWGGAVRPNFLGVAEIGPGYDHSAVPGRTPLIVPREDGAFYERAWNKALRHRPHIVVVETWNEFHEGTSIAESREHGRKYINLTRKYVDLYKRGGEPPAIEGPYRGARSVAIELGQTNVEQGLKQVTSEDGQTAPTVSAGKSCRETRNGPHGGGYIYFQIDDGFKWDRSMDVTVDVEYVDGSGGGFGIQYDSHDPAATLDGAYKDCAKRVPLQGTRSWKTASFPLKDARFDARQNAEADFRIATDAPKLLVRKVTVKRQ
ncbi:MAG: DUF5010 domain-containing protein [Isosphaeraceae bacterium]